MATVTPWGGATATYVYDAEGRRVEDTEANRLFWYGASGKLVETTDAGTTNHDYVYFAGRRIARYDSSGTVYYFYDDANGSVRTMTDASGTQLCWADYYPFGEPVAGTDCSLDNYQFAGLYTDASGEDGGYSAAHRRYSDIYNRWYSPDLGGRKVVDLANPQTWNLYAYALDNPTTNNDPSGLYTWAQGCGQKDAACQEQRQEFRNALTDLAKARNSFKPKSEAYKRLSRVLAAYGTEGHGGPAIAFGNVAKGLGGNFNPVTNTVKLDLARYGSSSLGQLNLGTLVAHEGEHYADRALQMATSQREYRAYEATSWTAQGEGLQSWYGISPTRGVLWNSTTSAPGANFNKGFLQIWQQDYEPLYPGPVVMPFDPFPGE